MGKLRKNRKVLIVSGALGGLLCLLTSFMIDNPLPIVTFILGVIIGLGVPPDDGYDG